MQAVSPAALAQGHGLAARISCARHGNVAEPAARLMVTDPRSRGWRRVSSTVRGNSGASSRNSTPRWARHSAPGRICPEPPPTREAMEAEWCGASNVGRVTSGAPGGSVPAIEWMRADLERGPLVQRREEAGQPLGQHRLAGARRAGHQQVVPAGGGHLHRPPSGRLPDDVAEVGERRRRRQPAADVP